MNEFILSDCTAVLRSNSTVNFKPVYLDANNNLFVMEGPDYVPVQSADGLERIEKTAPKDRIQRGENAIAA